MSTEQKRLRVVSTDATPRSIKLFLGDEEITPQIVPTRIMLEGDDLNTVWIEASWVDVDIEIGKILKGEVGLEPSIEILKRDQAEGMAALADEVREIGLKIEALENSLYVKGTEPRDALASGQLNNGKIWQIFRMPEGKSWGLSVDGLVKIVRPEPMPYPKNTSEADQLIDRDRLWREGRVAGP